MQLAVAVFARKGTPDARRCVIPRSPASPFAALARWCCIGLLFAVNRSEVEGSDLGAAAAFGFMQQKMLLGGIRWVRGPG